MWCSWYAVVNTYQMLSTEGLTKVSIRTGPWTDGRRWPKRGGEGKMRI